jgi:hypothetical protein
VVQRNSWLGSWLVEWLLVDRLAGWDSWLVASWLVGYQLCFSGYMIGMFFGWLVKLLISWLAGRLICWMSIFWSIKGFVHG